MALSKDQNKFTDDTTGEVYSAYPVQSYRCYSEEGLNCAFNSIRYPTCIKALCTPDTRKDKHNVIWFKEKEEV